MKRVEYNENHTPAYVFDLDRLKERVAAIRAGITREHTKICFAVKANPFLVETLKGHVDAFAICSPGEFHVCEQGNIPMEDVVVSGVFKAALDVARFIGEHEGKCVFTAESVGQLQTLDFCARMQKKRIRAILRLTSGNQFGMSEEELKECISQREQYENLDIQGIQFYSGPQKQGWGQIEEELGMLDDFCQALKREYGFEAELLEYGPGLSVPYFEKDEEEDLEQTMKKLDGLLLNLRFPGTALLEMGRFLTAYCGSYYTSVVDVKSHGGQNYCIVDGGIHHLNYYGQDMGEPIPHCTHLPQSLGGDREETLWNVCGCLCTASDALVRQMPMLNPTPGDLLIFERVGAYSVTDGRSLFGSQDLPEVYFFSQEMGMEPVREREGTCKLNMRAGEEDA
ncbi:MAG: diaminopimelate decarboxylase [Lachnospiraceae bacterium]|nr:diaminopimelate decarboxylase [Lachnospiraceae bacterium]